MAESKPQYRTARGWLTGPERSLLKSLAATVPLSGLILEIGGEYGASTVCLRAGNPGATIVTVDWFRRPSLDEHLSLLASSGVTDTLQFRGDSRIVGPLWHHPIDLLFIDGGHEYKTVCEDILNFTVHVKKDCVVAFHDYHGDHPLHAEVRRAVDEWLSSLWAEIPGADSIRAFRRISSASHCC